MADLGGSAYREAGVDIDAQEEALARVKKLVTGTFTPGVLSDVGSFGGLFRPELAGLEDPVLVASADGVGTKLMVARMAGDYSTVGRDLVNHCVNDILVQGARPLFFMDYVAVGKMVPEVVAQIIGGCALACQQNDLALLGGETAEMPGLYKVGDFDLAGFIVGSVSKEKLLDGSRVRPGQVLVALPSSGLHTNGYSLARKIVFEVLGLELDARPAELEGASVGEALLAVHRSYLEPLRGLLGRGHIAAMAHITGGGLLDNVPRVLGEHDAVIERSSWTVPPLFRWLCDAGRVDADEAYQAFNMGVGMVLFVDPKQVVGVLQHLRAAGETPFPIGCVEAGTGSVRWA